MIILLGIIFVLIYLILEQIFEEPSEEDNLFTTESTKDDSFVRNHIGLRNDQMYKHPPQPKHTCCWCDDDPMEGIEPM